MAYSHQLQADHCRQPPAWKGQWQDVKGHWWYMEACRKHAPTRNAWPLLTRDRMRCRVIRDYVVTSRPP